MAGGVRWPANCGILGAHVHSVTRGRKFVSDCIVLATCPFFADKLRNMPSTANMLKERYCRDEFELCARFLVLQKAGSDNVPADLFPHERERVEEILRGLGQ